MAAMPDDERERLKKRQEMEQGLAAFSENFPASWRRMYENLLAEQFSEEQAMRILLVSVHGLSGGSMKV